MNIFQRILSWFIPEIFYLFKCFVCDMLETLTLPDAKEKGWQCVAGKGWRCPGCSQSDTLRK